MNSVGLAWLPGPTEFITGDVTFSQILRAFNMVKDELNAVGINDVLETAASACEEPYHTENGFGVTQADNRCAALIRSMKK